MTNHWYEEIMKNNPDGQVWRETNYNNPMGFSAYLAGNNNPFTYLPKSSEFDTFQKTTIVTNQKRGLQIIRDDYDGCHVTSVVKFRNTQRYISYSFCYGYNWED